MDADAALARIRADIAKYGQHVLLVQSGAAPRFLYTVGASERLGHELVLAGTVTLMAREAHRVIQRAAAGEDVEGFRLADVDRSWSEPMLLAVSHHYGRHDVPARQLVPEGDLWTVDVPDMSRPYHPNDVAWRWLTEPWDLPFPRNAVSVSDLDALRGSPVREAARWEEDQWECFHGEGPDLPRDQLRIVPLATLLAADPSFEPVTRLSVGAALRRDDHRSWQPWGPASPEGV